MLISILSDPKNTRLAANDFLLAKKARRPTPRIGLAFLLYASAINSR